MNSIRSHLLTPMVFGLLLVTPAAAFAASWEIDAGHSRMGFAVKHMMVSNVRGQFKKFSAVLDIDDKDPSKSKVEVTVDTASIDTGDEKRDAHLKSAEFFDSDKHPKMTFKSTKVAKEGAGYKVLGDLTIRGVTKPITLAIEGPSKPAKDPWGNMKSGASVTGALNRKDFGLVWNMPLEGGGFIVGDEVKLEIDAELLKK